MTGAPPAGYVRVTAGRCSAIVLQAHESDARALLAEGTPYEAAARDLAARPLSGRGIAYSIALPVSGTRAVVRHNRHGGLLAPLTRDLFLPPTRAPHELAVALRLAAAGVRTPAVLMYAVERRALLFRRADVVSRAVEDSRDLSAWLMPGTLAEERAEAWSATRRLVDALHEAGARHHDLNVKNVLIAGEPGRFEAWVLDVDRVVFGAPRDERLRAANLARLARSARKWRDTRGGEFKEPDLDNA